MRHRIGLVLTFIPGEEQSGFSRKRSLKQSYRNLTFSLRERGTGELQPVLKVSSESGCINGPLTAL